MKTTIITPKVSEAIASQTQQIFKSFIYLGKRFTPVRQFTASEDALGLRLPLRSIGISNYKGGIFTVANHISDQYDYDTFYKKAKSVGAGEIDVFLTSISGDKIEVVPCTNELFRLRASF